MAFNFQIFCLSTTIAVIFLFIYQLTFFAAAIALGGRREEKQINGLLCCLKSKSKSIVEQDVLPMPKRRLEAQASLDNQKRNRCPNIGHHEDKISTAKRATHGILSIFKNPKDSGETPRLAIAVHILNDDWWHKISIKMADMLCNIYCRLCVVMLLIVYWILAVWGCMHIELGLTPEKLFLPDSAVLKSVTIESNLLLNVFVHHPPDFSNNTEVQTFLNLVTELQSIPEFLGDSTSLWQKSFLEYLSFMGLNETTEFYESIPDFLEASDYARWKHYIQYEKNATSGEVVLNRFFFTVAYRRHRSWTERIYYTKVFREIAEKYKPYFNISIYCDDNNNFVVDQLESIPSNTLQVNLKTF